jgi:hypothetical protein
LVVEDATKVVTVGEDVGLVRQVGASTVDEVDARKAVLLSDFLSSEVLLDCDGVVGAAFDTTKLSPSGSKCLEEADSRAVVGDNHTHGTLDCANARHDACGRSVFSRIDLVGGQSRQFKKRCAGVDQGSDAARMV